MLITNRGGVEDTRFAAKDKDTPSEDRPSLGQGQKCSRPSQRPRTQGGSGLQKKGLRSKLSQIFCKTQAIQKKKN